MRISRRPSGAVQSAIDEKIRKEAAKFSSPVLGSDRSFARYFKFSSLPGLYRQYPDSNTWEVFKDKESVVAFLATLNERGERERALRASVLPHLDIFQSASEHSTASSPAAPNDGGDGVSQRSDPTIIASAVLQKLVLQELRDFYSKVGSMPILFLVFSLLLTVNAPPTYSSATPMLAANMMILP